MEQQDYKQCPYDLVIGRVEPHHVFSKSHRRLEPASRAQISSEVIVCFSYSRVGVVLKRIHWVLIGWAEKLRKATFLFHSDCDTRSSTKKCSPYGSISSLRRSIWASMLYNCETNAACLSSSRDKASSSQPRYSRSRNTPDGEGNGKPRKRVE